MKDSKIDVWSLALLAVLALNPALAWTPAPGEDGAGQAQPYLGIGGNFGRWTGPVRLVYDPDDAPSAFQDPEDFLLLVERAAAEWEAISGIDFEFLGVDSTVPDDWESDDPDGLVRIHWGETEGHSIAQAGPSKTYFDYGLGYFPYTDGVLTVDRHHDFSSEGEDWEGEMVRILVHEMGHLIGLGHSDNPHSIMFANPYTHLRHPREDDIRAARALYGPPEAPLDPAALVPDWLYQPPPFSQRPVMDYLFKGNSQWQEEAHLSLGDSDGQPLQLVDENSADGQWVRFNPGGYGGADEDILIETVVILVDPSGYTHSRSHYTLDCQAGYICGGGWVSLAKTEVLKTLPGEWRVYVVDEATDPADPVTLWEASLRVQSDPRRNRAPRAVVRVRPGEDSQSAQITLEVADAEADAVTAIWHIPGQSPLHREMKDASDTRTIRFPASGPATVFIQVNDDAVHYDDSIPGSSYAGGGFRHLLRLDLELPLKAGIVSRSIAPALLPELAGAKALGSARPSSSAEFFAAASVDGGYKAANEFRLADRLTIAGTIVPQASDLGKPGDLFVAAQVTTANGKENWYMQDLDGRFLLWDRKLPSLVPAHEVDALHSMESLELYAGRALPATLKVFLGYRVRGSSELHYNKLPLVLDID